MTHRLTITQLANTKIGGHDLQVWPKGSYPAPKDFMTVSEDSDDFGLLADKDESVPANLIGIVLDLLARDLIVGQHETAFENAEKGAQLVDRLPDFKQQVEALHQATAGSKFVNSAAGWQAAFELAKYEAAYRSGHYDPAPVTVDPITIRHLQIMLQRIKGFFDRYGTPTVTGFTVESSSGAVYGDGDYLSPDYLMDLKIYRTSPLKRLANRIQLELYYVLGKDNGRYKEFQTIKALILFNPREDNTYILGAERITPEMTELALERINAVQVDK
ncbi:hypothetical protein [Limosilactobacillus sp.]|jgi:hypothetical protein|uniref:hypothetical protein n=1 Tax=Limosilactobacillus sp. TaxID=2773925 RepID=UPI0025C3921B|nr:hypothetical protein [Limosilactobacillus sp.]MCH3922861.1 hypothetical protein [Limosilactobacillus sp.]MCH3927544.1 hypothetical protein [Limosilactobacillus sp.]